MRFKSTRYAGFTLVELLVVLVVIGILIALSLPAIVAARESGRKVACQSNLRQIAIGCATYHDQKQHFPIGRFVGPLEGQSGRDAASWSWMADLLPYVEEQQIYDVGGIPNSTHEESGICHQVISLYLCPSVGRRANKSRSDRGGIWGLTVGMTNYHAVSGANWGADASQQESFVDTDWRNIGTNGSYDGLESGDGMMHRSDYRRPRKLRDVRDGAGSTFLLGEVHPVINNRVSWPYANNAYSTCAIPPNLVSKKDGRHAADDWPNVGGFRSEHPNGVFFATVDGAVRFINEDIELSIYRAMATIAGD